MDKRKKVKPNIQVNDLVRTAGLRKTFSKGDTTSLSYILDEITETINETIPKYHIDNLPERYIDALLNETEVTMKEKNMLWKP